MDNTDVKNEFFANITTVSFCRVCLSTGRALSAANEYVDIFCKFFDNPDLIQLNILLCWECVALLKKFKMFKRKLADAQKLLQLWYKNKQDPFPHALSTLSISQQNKEIKIIKEEDELKPVKTESDFDNLDTFDNFDFDTIDTDIKDELEPESIKVDLESKIDIEPVKSDENYRKSKEFNEKRNRQRKAKYRILNTKLKKHRNLLITKTAVDIREVMKSLEAERKEDWFVKAEHKCVSCVEVFEDAEKVTSHNEKYHDPSRGVACVVCAARCAPAELAAHAARHGRRACRACAFASCAPAAARRHAPAHGRVAQCRACGLLFANVRRFYDHHKALHSSFECDVCGKRCKTRAMIERHLRRHFGYECPFCKKKLKNSSTYSNHIEVQHTNSFAEAAYCVQCDKRFKSEKLYKRHLTVSSAHACERANRAKRKYPCPECSNVYSRRTYMNNHYRHVHSKESKYYCEDCDQHFLNRTRYLDHRRFKHEGARREKDKLCNICGRGFAANRTLENHLRTHSGERPFACGHCGAKFTQKHAMLSHVQYIHLKSKRKPNWRE